MNVALIVLDTLRYDTAQRLFLPKLKEAFGNVIALKGFAQSSWTLPSHASFLSGLLPRYSVLWNRENMFLSIAKSDTLMLHKMDIEKWLISANVVVSSTYGFKGWDREIYIGAAAPVSNTLSEEETKLYMLLRSKYSLPRTAIELIKMGRADIVLRLIPQALKKYLLPLGWPKEKGVKQAIKAVRKLPKEYFLLLNLLEVHEPYLFRFDTRGYRQAIMSGKVDGLKWISRYWEFAEYLSKMFLKVVNNLPNRDETLVVIISDHGQLLGEHGAYGHGRYLYDELLDVPIYIIPPDGEEWSPPKGKVYPLQNLPKFMLRAVNEDKVDFDLLPADYAFAEVMYRYDPKVGIRVWKPWYAVRTPRIKVVFDDDLNIYEAKQYVLTEEHEVLEAIGLYLQERKRLTPREAM